MIDLWNLLCFLEILKSALPSRSWHFEWKFYDQSNFDNSMRNPLKWFLNFEVNLNTKVPSKFLEKHCKYLPCSELLQKLSGKWILLREFVLRKCYIDILIFFSKFIKSVSNWDIFTFLLKFIFEKFYSNFGKRLKPPDYNFLYVQGGLLELYTLF